MVASFLSPGLEVVINSICDCNFAVFTNLGTKGADSLDDTADLAVDTIFGLVCNATFEAILDAAVDVTIDVGVGSICGATFEAILDVTVDVIIDVDLTIGSWAEVDDVFSILLDGFATSKVKPILELVMPGF